MVMRSLTSTGRILFLVLAVALAGCRSVPVSDTPEPAVGPFVEPPAEAPAEAPAATPPEAPADETAPEEADHTTVPEQVEPEETETDAPEAALPEAAAAPEAEEGAAPARVQPAGVEPAAVQPAPGEPEARETVVKEPETPETAEPEEVLAVLEEPEEPLRVPPRPVLIAYLEEQIAPPVYMVTREGEPLIQLKDLDRDGFPEILVPCVELEEEYDVSEAGTEEAGTEASKADVETEAAPEDGGEEEPEVASAEEPDTGPDTDQFADFSSLYRKDSQPYLFSLCVFRVTRSGIELLFRLNLGYRFIYGGIRSIPIVEGREAPFALVVTFQTRDSEEQEWFLFREGYYKPISKLSLRDSYTNTIQVEDIDEDGVIDIVVKDSGAEEGVGLESFLTWLKWNGREFREAASTNVVRSLRGFLGQVKERLLDRDWQVLVETAFLPQDAAVFREQGWTDEEILFHAFSLDEIYDDPEQPAADYLSGIKEFFYPDILEDPFLSRDDRGAYFQLTYRVVDVGGVSLVSRIPLYMQKNPFSQRQFFLGLD
jgi:hypothetical protein